jgi:deoxycytidylate deaminase
MCNLVRGPINKFALQIDLLEKVAKTSDVIHKHASCLMKGDKIIAIGVNKYFQVRVNQMQMNLCVHAEMNVFASTRLTQTKGMNILVIRINNNMMLRNSRPCNACIDKLKQKGIKKVYYSNADGQIVYEFVDTMPKLHTSSGCKVRMNN